MVNIPNNIVMEKGYNFRRSGSTIVESKKLSLKSIMIPNDIDCSEDHSSIYDFYGALYSAVPNSIDSY